MGRCVGSGELVSVYAGVMAHVGRVDPEDLEIVLDAAVVDRVGGGHELWAAGLRHSRSASFVESVLGLGGIVNLDHRQGLIMVMKINTKHE